MRQCLISNWKNFTLIYFCSIFEWDAWAIAERDVIAFYYNILLSFDIIEVINWEVMGSNQGRPLIRDFAPTCAP